MPSAPFARVSAGNSFIPATLLSSDTRSDSSLCSVVNVVYGPGVRDVPEESKDTRDTTNGQDLALDNSFPFCVLLCGLGNPKAYVFLFQFLLRTDVKEGQ